MSNKVPCPTGCGWFNGNPELDEDGLPYTCFLCGNSGEVSQDTLDAWAKAVAKEEG